MKLPFLASFLVFGAWLTYELHKTKEKEKNCLNDFWQKERDANSVRKKSLDNLNYIQIPFDKLPMDTLADNETIASYHTALKNLADTKIVNFTGITNTELKLTYGTANISVLTEYDQNYMFLARTLWQWGELLYNEGYIAEAVRVLEFSIDIGTDVSGCYKLLASIYKQGEETEKLDSLYKHAESLQSLMKNPIIKSLNDICHNAESDNQ